MTWAYVMRAAELIGANALAAVVVAMLALLPGYGLARGAARRLGWGLDTTLPVAFGVTLGAVTVFAVLADRTFGLLGAGVLALVLSGAGWWWGGRQHVEAVPATVERAAWFTGVGAAILALVEGPYMGVTGDTFYHLASVRSLLERGAALVRDPVYGTATTAVDPSAGTWHTMVALWAKVTMLDPAWLWGGFNVVAAGLLALAFWALARRVSGSARAATIATWAWIVFAQFADLRMAAFPKVGTLAIVFVVFAVSIDLAERPSLVGGAAAALGMAGVLGSHLGSAQLVLTGAGAIVVWLAVRALVMRWRDSTPAGPGLRAVALTAVAGAALGWSALWVRLGPLGGSGGLGSGLGDITRAALDARLVQLPLGLVVGQPGTLTGGGAALAVVAGLAALAMLVVSLKPGGTAAAVAGAGVAALPLITVYDPLFAGALYRISPYVLERVGALLGFCAYLAIAWCLGSLFAEGRARTLARASAYLGLVAAVVGASANPVLTFARVPGLERRGARYPVYVTRLQDMRYVWGDGLRQAGLLASRSPAPPVVAGDLETCYYLVGLERFSAMAMLKSHSPYVVENESGPARRADNERLMALGTIETERRAILERWNVGFVAFWLERPAQRAAYDEMRAQSGLFAPVVETPTLAMIEVLR